jgi:hypothetical protein
MIVDTNRGINDPNAYVHKDILPFGAMKWFNSRVTNNDSAARKNMAADPIPYSWIPNAAKACVNRSEVNSVRSDI